MAPRHVYSLSAAAFAKDPYSGPTPVLAFNDPERFALVPRDLQDHFMGPHHRRGQAGPQAEGLGGNTRPIQSGFRSNDPVRGPPRNGWVSPIKRIGPVYWSIPAGLLSGQHSTEERQYTIDVSREEGHIWLQSNLP